MDRTRWYLEMTSPDQVRPALHVGPAIELREVESVLLYRQVHRRVGAPHGWSSVAWSDARWDAEFARSDLRHWIATRSGDELGVVAVELRSDGDFELLDFGIVPEVIGSGVGGRLLTLVVRRLWGAGARRIWLHTQYSDHSHALNNYLARGFTVFRTELAPVRGNEATEVRDR